jgi:hypothetical protein
MAYIMESEEGHFTSKFTVNFKEFKKNLSFTVNLNFTVNSQIATPRSAPDWSPV